MRKTRSKRNFRLSLRIYIAIISIVTLCLACCISCIIVIAGMKFLYQGVFTLQVAVVMCLIVCILTMLIGGIALWAVSRQLTKSLLNISNAVKKIAQGDFSVVINCNLPARGKYKYTNEIDELTDNVNKMAAELKGMDYLRKDFMSNVSHEIKTPVAAITGFTEILLDGGLSKEDEKEYLRLVNQESVRLSRLSGNMLRMSRLDNQAIVFKKDRIQLDEQIRKCIIILTEKWSEHEISFELNLEKIKIISDYDMLFQVWINLLDNAIKYSDVVCKIYVTIKLLDDNYVKVCVRDEGIGISEEKITRIFDKFYQCEESHKKNGNGLGLSIVKRIIELLHGVIECESKIGQGTTFTVVIPLIENF
ncbi:MAG: HAMP domain-containing sensor histidine kinase [Mobilitalea sp.]